MNYLETMKNILKDKKRKKENLIFILVLLVILLICINYIFSGENEEEDIVEDKIEEQTACEDDLEEKLAQILNEITGISDASVIINYKSDGKSSIVYDTKETYSEDGNVLTVEKSVAYNEEDGDKIAIIQMYETPEVEGVIIVLNGTVTSELKSKLASAIGNLLGVASYKVQVF